MVCKWPLCICPAREHCQLKQVNIKTNCPILSNDEGARDLSNTHTLFFSANIIVETEKAFRIKVINRKGAQTTVWVPKSRCIVELCMRRTQEPPHDYVELKKYYAPNFFIK
jgi:hypothetical protein